MAYMLESHSANTCIFNLALNRPNGNRTNTRNLALNTERPSTRRLSFAFFVLGSCAVQDYIFFLVNEIQMSGLLGHTLEEISGTLSHTSVDVGLKKSIE